MSRYILSPQDVAEDESVTDAMRIDGVLRYQPGDPASAPREAKLAAEMGYDRLFTAETAHDPFLPLAQAAQAADVDLGTYIAVAFARNPMTTAVVAHDLQSFTGGRFVLGLGSQVKAHITRRFSMPWSHPAARMREFVLAMRAIWASWQDGAPLNFTGEFYQHTLSSPIFDPGQTPFGPPKVLLAAVGPRMTEVAGEVADGLVCHAFTTRSYLAEVTLPTLRKAAVAAGRPPGDVEVALPAFIATGPPGRDLTPKVEAVRKQIAFYASTPAYRGVLDHHGWGDLHTELHRLSRDQRWDEMTKLVDDRVLQAFVVIADASGLAKALSRRFGGLVTSLNVGVPYADDPDLWAPVIAALKNEPAP
jgi:probable F420-dependent oxidoreductase